MGAKHGKGLTYAAVYLAAAAVCQIIELKGSCITRRAVKLGVSFFHGIDKALLRYAAQCVVTAELLKADCRRKGQKQPALNYHFAVIGFRTLCSILRIGYKFARNNSAPVTCALYIILFELLGLK